MMYVSRSEELSGTLDRKQHDHHRQEVKLYTSALENWNKAFILDEFS